MRRSHKLAASVVAALSIGVAAATFAHPGGMGSGMHGGPANPVAPQHPMTPEARSDLCGKMRNASLPEGRQKLAIAHRAEIHKRTKENGFAAPEHHPRSRATLESEKHTH